MKPLVRPALLCVCLSLGLSGCVSSILSNMAVKAPNQQRQPRAVRDAAYAKKYDDTYALSWKFPVGPPPAELAVAVVEPGNYHFKYEVVLREAKSGRKYWAQNADWTPRETNGDPRTAAAKGTVLLLHGYMDAKENMMHWALALAEAGYRTVLVDLRGHGRSTGDLITYGAVEARDLSQVIDDLQRRGLMGDQLGVVGVSYGASTGLLLAARDARVATVVALEPYSRADEALVEFAHGVAPTQAAKISDDNFAAAVRRAPKLGGFSWEENNVLAAMSRIKVPVLFFHGAKDKWISPEHSRKLYAAAPSGSGLGILDKDDHIYLSLRLDFVLPETLKWFAKQLPAAPVATTAGNPLMPAPTSG